MPVSLASAPATTHGAVVPIGYTKITSDSNFITFSSIPQGYQDLYAVVFGRSTTASAFSDQYMRLATGGGAVDTGTNYSVTRLYGNGASATSDRGTSETSARIGSLPAASSTSGIFGSSEHWILNYANTSTNKTILTRSAADTNGSGFTNLEVALWRNTGAITSVQFIINGNYLTNSVFALYGIRSVNQ